MRIYIFTVRDSDGRLIGQALADDGSTLVQHYISAPIYTRHEMGLSSKKHHAKFRQHCPDGFELVDLTQHSVEQLYKHRGLAAALERHHKAAAESEVLAQLGDPPIEDAP